METKSKTHIWTWKVQNSNDRADREILKAIQAELESSQESGDESGKELAVLSRSQLKRLIEEGKVTEDFHPIKSNQKLRDGAILRIEIPPPQSTELVPEDRPIEVLFEDENIIVVNKPQGLTVHPSPTQMEGTLVHALLHHVKDLSGIGGVLRPGIVHRIDKNTSGALVITKTDLAHQKLSEVFSKHEIERCYWALCFGAPPNQSGKIESLIGRSLTDRKKMSMTVKTGRKAITYFKQLERYGRPKLAPFASWLEVKLETGRTHQVRVHLTGAGQSILGDPVYGLTTDNQSKWKALPSEIQALVGDLPGQALHARVLGFKHPITGESLRFEAEPPASFKKLHSALQSKYA